MRARLQSALAKGRDYVFLIAEDGLALQGSYAVEAKCGRVCRFGQLSGPFPLQFREFRHLLLVRGTIARLLDHFLDRAGVNQWRALVMC
jgi:hypothetical protein